MKNFALPLLIVVVYVMFIVPQARKRKRATALRREVEPGAEVMLTSGLFGTVVEIDDDTVVIEAAEGVRLRYAKGAVQRVLPEPVDDDLDDTEGADNTDDSGDSGDTDDSDTDHSDTDDSDQHEHGDTHNDGDLADHGLTDDTIDDNAPSRDVVARPANRFKRSTRSRSTGNDAGSGPVPTS